jgi:hypothetical protein
MRSQLFQPLKYNNDFYYSQADVETTKTSILDETNLAERIMAMNIRECCCEAALFSRGSEA